MFVIVALQIHELSMKLALQKSQNNELRSQFEGQLSCNSSFVINLLVVYLLKPFVNCI